MAEKITNKEILEKLNNIENQIESYKKEKKIKQIQILKIGVVFGVLFGIICGVLVNIMYSIKNSLAENHTVAPFDVLTFIIFFGVLIFFLYLVLKKYPIGK